jgi:hypothetical protein
VGNSSGDENGSNSMKYWEIIADRLHAQGWSYGIAEHFTQHGFLFCFLHLFVPLTAFTINDFCRASAKAHATRDSSPYNG